MKLQTALLCLGVSLFPTAPTSAADLLWNGGGADNLWSNALNWSGVTFTPGDLLQFSGSVQLSTQNDLAADTLVGGINFLNNTNTSTAAFTLNGNRIILGGNINTIAVTGGAFNATINNIINLDILLNGTRTITVANITDKTHNLTINGVIGETGGSYGLNTAGGARLTLNGENTYTGPTVLGGTAVVVLGHAGALPGGTGTTGGTSALSFSGGILGLGAGDFSRGLGTGADQVQWTGSGGFAAFGAPRTVNIGGSSAVMVWNSGGFVPTGSNLLCGYGNGSDTQDATHTVEMVNPIDLNGGTRTITVNDGNGTANARIDAVLSGGLKNSTGMGALTKTGGGTLSLTAASTYTGQTFVNGGVLLVEHALALPGGIAVSGGTSNLRLGGNGVFGLGTGDFTRATGTGAAQVQWTAGGGFAAYGADRTVNLGGEGALVTWGAGGFVPSGSSFYLGASSATHTITFVNPIDLGAANRVLEIQESNLVALDAVISGAISGTGGLQKNNDGTLLLSSAASTYTGQTYLAVNVTQVTKLADFGQPSSLGAGTEGVPITMSTQFRVGTLNYIGTGDSSNRTFSFGMTNPTYTNGGVIQNNGTGALIFTAPGFNAAIPGVTAARTLTLSGSNTDLNTIQGVIQNTDGATGVLNVLKDGPGTWVLAGANTYSGTTTVTAGALHLNHPSALGTGTLVLNTNGILDSSAASPITLANANPVTISGSFIFGGTNDLNLGSAYASITGTRTVTLNGTARTLTLGGLNFTSTSGNSTLTANNGGGGSRLIVGGIILADNNQARSQTINGSGEVEVTGTVANGPGTGADSLSYTGTGSLKLSGNNTYTGTLTINNSAGTVTLSGSNTTTGVTLTAGRLNLEHAAALGTGTLTLTAGTIDNTSGAALALSYSGNVVLGGSISFGGGHDLSLSSGTVSTTGSRTITLNGTSRTLSFGPLSITNTITITVNDAGSGNKLEFGGIVLAEADQARVQTFNGSGAVQVNGPITDGPGTGADGISYTGTGSLRLSGSNTYTGATTMNNAAGTLTLAGSSTTSSVTLTAGRLNLEHAAALGGGTLTLTAGTIDNTSAAALATSTANTVVWAGNFAYGGTQDLSLAAGSVSITGGRTITLNGTDRTLTFGPASYTATTTTTVNDAGTGNKLVLGGLALAEANVSRTQTFAGNAPIVITGSVADGPGTGADGITYTGNSILTFQAASSYTGTTGINTALGTLRVTSTGSLGTGALALSQGTVDLQNSAQTVAALTLGNSAATGPAVLTLAASTVLTQTGTLTYNSSTALQPATISGGSIDLGGARTWTINDSIGLDDDLTVSSSITNSSAGTWTKNGAGRLVLSGANTFTDAFSISDGIVRITHAQALGTSAGGTTVSSGRALELLNVSIAAEPLSLNGTGISLGGALRNIAGNNTYGGPITLAGGARINSDAGTLTLSSGSPITSSSTLTFGGAGNITLNDSYLPTTTTQTLTKDGSGTLLLVGATGHTSGTTINAGTLRLGASERLADTSGVTVASGLFDLDGYDETMGSLTLGGLAGTASVTTGTGLLKLTGITFNATNNPLGATISGRIDIGTATRTFTINDSTSADDDLTITATISSGAGSGLLKVGAGTLVLSAVNTYTGNTTLRGGLTRFTVDGALPTGGGLSLQNRATVAPVSLDLAGTSQTVGTITLTEASDNTNQLIPGAQTSIIDSVGGAVLRMTAGATYNAGPAGEQHGPTLVAVRLDLNGANRTFTINDSDQTTEEVTISGIILNSSGTVAGLTKSNAGTLILSGANTYDGNTTINTGVLRAAHSSALGTAGTVALANSDAILELGQGVSIARALTVSDTGNKKTLRLQDGAASATYAGNITLSETTAGNFEVSAASGGLLTLGGVISGTAAVGLTKVGAGTLALSGLNTHTSPTWVNEGALQVGVAGVGRTGRGAVTLASGTALLGTGTVRGSSLTLPAGAALHVGDSTADASLGTLNFTPAAGGGTYSLQGSLFLGIGTPTNLATLDPDFGGNEVGSAGYLAYINHASRSTGSSGGHDLLSFNAADSGTYTLQFLSSSGSLTVNGTGFTGQMGAIYNLLDWTGLTGGVPDFGSFNVGTNYRSGGTGGGALNLPTLDIGLVWDVSQFTTSGVIVVVPEPARALLLLVGLTSLLLRRRR
ncbi:MAG: autotransporter-associated beta strand repeat-containing protein [Prosthecobacter sp.]|nr:autotransporter-associated beta strand repeat-containing protein [Prosthecobacter sp.]